MKTGMKDFDKGFEPEVKEVLEARNQHKAGERNLGNDPKTGKVSTTRRALRGWSP